MADGVAARPRIAGLSLCSGVAGLELGLRLALGPTYQTVAFCERDAYAAAALVARMEDAALDHAPIWDDLESFPGWAFRGKVDILSAGFPCQPWSVAGKRGGTDDERWIWPAIWRIICDVEPAIVFLENVPGLLVPDGIGEVLGSLAELGFDAEWTCLRASDVGAPHQRNRVFILADAGCVSSWGRQPLTEPRSGDQAAAGESDATMAYAGSPKRRPDVVGGGSRGERVNGQGQAPSGSSEQGEALADADERGRIICTRAIWEPRMLSDAAGGRPQLADAEREPRSAEYEQAPRGRAHVGTGHRTVPSYGCFPPGPDDAEAWRELLVQHPELRPAISQAETQSELCRVADEFPARMERLRCLGNAVVPAQAAAAFSELAGRFPGGP